VGRREGSAPAAARESGEEARASAHSPPHTAVKESQSSSSACTHSRRFMLQLGPPWPDEPARGSGRRGGTPGGKETREPRLARAGTELVWLPGRVSVRAPAPPQAAGLRSAAASLCRRWALSKADLGGSGQRWQSLSKRLALLGPGLQVPRGPGCQRECSPLTPGAAFCSLWLGREPTWSCGHREGCGGGGAGRGRGSAPPAPPPARHALCSPGQGARGIPEVAPQQRLRSLSDNPQQLPGQCPPGRGPRVFGDLKAFKHRKHLGRWRGTLNPFSPGFLNSCQETWALKEGPHLGCPHSLPPSLTLSVLLPLATFHPQGFGQDPPQLVLLCALRLQLNFNKAICLSTWTASTSPCP
jgi:hypothetical protein